YPIARNPLAKTPSPHAHLMRAGGTRPGRNTDIYEDIFIYICKRREGIPSRSGGGAGPACENPREISRRGRGFAGTHQMRSARRGFREGIFAELDKREVGRQARCGARPAVRGANSSAVGEDGWMA